VLFYKPLFLLLLASFFMAGSTDDTTSIAPGFLVASPRLDGSPFERAVILLIHHDAQGTIGYIVNKPVQVDFGTLIASVNEPLEDAILEQHFEQTVYFGGPVRLEQLWVLFKNASPGGSLDAPSGDQSDGMASAEEAIGVSEDGEVIFEPPNLEFGDHWSLSASGRVIESFAVHQTDDFFMPLLGYAGWGAGQLETEIEEGSWLVQDFDESLIFETEPADRWRHALEMLGVQPTAFLMMGKLGSA
jgi:putative transcriptional regulator